MDTAKAILQTPGKALPMPVTYPADCQALLAQQGAFDGSGLDQVTRSQVRQDDASEPPGDKPSFRLLSAVEIIARSGPMSFKALGGELGLPKATTWRLVNTLRDANWVRLRKGGSLIELDPRLDHLFATANFADGEFCSIAEILGDVAQTFGIHIDLFTPNRNGELNLQDTSRRVTITSSATEPLEEALFLALYAAMTPSQFDRHIAQMAGHLDAETLRNMNSAATRRKVQQFAGYAWTLDSRILFVSLRGALGSAAVLRMSGKSAAVDRPVLASAYEKLAELLPQKGATLGKGKPTATGR